MAPAYRLSPLISFQTLPGMAVLLDHARHDVHTLNVEAGEALERINRQEGTLSEDDEEFARQLVELGMAALEPESAEQEFSGEGRSQPQDDPGQEEQEEEEEADEDEGGPLAELNAHAAQHLVPLHLQLELTHRCPLSCRHCYLGAQCSRGSASDELTTAEVAVLLDDVRGLGGLFLVLTGGEPLLRPDLEQIVGAARDRRMSVSFNTSGFGFSKDLLTRLSRRGLDAAQVSLYGPDGESHDAMTGVSGSFAQAMGCLRTLRDLGVRALAAVTPTTLMPEDGAKRLSELLVREGLGAALGLFMQPRRDGDGAPQQLTLDEAGLRRVRRFFPPGSRPRMAALSPNDRPCGAGVNTVSVDPRGEVYPCLPMRTSLGSIRVQPFAKIWRDSPGLSQIRSLTLADLERCNDCDLRQHCNRCAGFAVAEGKGVNGHCAFDCLMARVVSKEV